MADDIPIFGGSGSPRLTRKICEYLDVQPGAGELLRFSEGNLFVRVQENVRGRRVYVVHRDDQRLPRLGHLREPPMPAAVRVHQFAPARPRLAATAVPDVRPVRWQQASFSAARS